MSIWKNFSGWLQIPKSKRRQGKSNPLLHPDLAVLVSELPIKRRGRNQTAAEGEMIELARLGFKNPPPHISSREAMAIFSCSRFADTTLELVSDSDAVRNAIRPALIAFIVENPAIFNRANRWSYTRWIRFPAISRKPKRDSHWRQVLAEAERLAEVLRSEAGR